MDEPRPLVEGVDHVLADLGAPSADTVAAVVGEWANLVGAGLAARTEPRSIEHGRLLVQTDDPAVAEQLRWSERRILDRLADLVGAGVVDRVDVRVRP
jgi:hypothetical protein